MIATGWTGPGRPRGLDSGGVASALLATTWGRASTNSRQSTFPYHYELGNDELLVVVAGRPTLRASDGERELQPGDCVLFPSGPDGAHQLVNRSNEPTRVLLVSNFAMPRAAVQVDSGKMMIRWGVGEDDRRWFRLEDAVEYWEGEGKDPSP